MYAQRESEMERENLHIEWWASSRFISSIFICQHTSPSGSLFAPFWSFTTLSPSKYCEFHCELFSRVSFDDENKYFFLNEMLLVLRTPLSIQHPISPPTQRPVFPYYALSSVETVTRVTVEWKINKIKGKSLAFRQKEETRKSNKNLYLKDAFPSSNNLRAPNGSFICHSICVHSLIFHCWTAWGKFHSQKFNSMFDFHFFKRT